MKSILFLLLVFSSLFATDFSKNDREQFLKKIPSKSTLYTQNTYQLDKGWNTLRTPNNGVNVNETFNNEAIELVSVYDAHSKLWATYAPGNKKSVESLFAKYIEPNITFFVRAKKSVELSIKSNRVNSTCQKLMNSKEYSYVFDSALSKEATQSNDKKLSVNSRYFSHYDKGIYNDTRVVVIYPNIKTITKATYRYGPAEPKAMIHFAKEFEGKIFYMYDFLERGCYKGMFPSMKIPPFAVLKKLK